MGEVKMEVMIGGLTQPVKITRKRMKNINLRISKDGEILISCPRYASEAEIRRLIYLNEAWILDQQLKRIQDVAEREGKPFMFMECGCPSRLDSENRPNDWNYGRGISPETQARWYEAFLEAVERHPFVRGVGWWDWSATRLYPEYAGEDNPGYCTWGKPANRLIRKFSEKAKQIHHSS